MTATTETANTDKPKRKLGDALGGLMPKKAPASTTPSLPLNERLARQQVIAKELPSLEQQASRVHQRIASARVKQNHARDRVTSLQATVERESTGKGEPQSKGRLKAAEEELQSINQRVTAHEHHLLELQSDINTLNGEMETLIDQGASEEEVREHLRALKHAEAEVARLEALIRDIQSTTSPDRSSDQELDALQQAREDLLADIAAGDAKADELEALDAEIQEILEDGDGSQATALGQERDNAQTLAGLKRRLSAVKSNRDALQQQTPAVIEWLLIAQGEGLAREYRQHAEALMACYRRIQGVADVLTSAVPQTQVRLLPETWSLLMIPGLPLHAFDGADHHDAGRSLFFLASEARNRGELKAASAEHLEKLREMGLGELFEQGQTNSRA